MRSFAIAAMAVFASACAPPGDDNNPPKRVDPLWRTLDGEPPLIIAHRGASGYLPEHTLEAYELAIEQGADVIEPDLVFTKDGVLVARHDRYLSTTTDIAGRPEFAARRKPNEDAGDARREDWWVEDFTLAEIKTLRAVQPREGRPKEFDGLYEIPTFEEVLALVTEKAAAAGRPVGVYPETKHPGYFQSIGMDFEEPLLAALEGFSAGPVFIQSFEPEILKHLKGKTDAKLVQLVYEETPSAGPNIPLAEIAEYADGVGPPKELLFPSPTLHIGLLHTAHNLELFVHPWTFRNDASVSEVNGVFASPNSRYCTSADGSLDADSLLPYKKELYAAFGSWVDGVFTDFPDTAVEMRRCIAAFPNFPDDATKARGELTKYNN